ncbi:MAG: large-conductance mechanosensitive channel protein MscL [Bacteroidales bacterium]|nr:large-conductance mechanosensitive channel protein MscL [Bacteroidales bacterium]MCF8343532.1 large-conductance mechanosensitive channel protein MscL [Bacteroidales bacterium]MCF8349823.1 large-conductance mechanosensitive channel protein MscL [Bacteroidales bacterium]MCF8375943.1 large-conductance mechanosensitive channel protein MscL [Bacteroidales bacterium]
MVFIKEFKTFIKRGNVMDMAIGIIIGAAFGKIVNALVNNIIMPPIGMLVNDSNFTALKIVLKKAVYDENDVLVRNAVTVDYGLFIQTLVNFLIIALVIFWVVKGMNRMKKKEEAKPAPPPAPSKEEQLLTEIRDLLKKE